MESVPGSSKDDPSKPRAKRSKLSRESNTGDMDYLSLSKQNSPGLFHRVTNSVSGLLSNVSWSDWLNTSISKGGNESMSSHEKPEHNIILSTPHNPQFLTDEAIKNKKNMNPLYPEEGILYTNGSKTESRYPNVSKPESSFATAIEYSCFEKARPVYASTPSIGLLQENKSRKIERIYGEGISPIPSTSGVCNEASIFIENSLGLLRKSLYNSQEDSTFPNLNGSLPASASKKRLYDQNYIIEESEPLQSSDETTLHSILPKKDSLEAPLKKRPRFSISSFGSPLFYKQDLIPTSKQDLNDSSLSVFYPGKIMYGGAYNYNRHAARLANRKVIPRANLTSNVNSCNEFEDGGLSTAAKRILNCIDKISTPLSNSKRIYFSKQREPDSPSYVADFHKHRPSLKSSGDINSPPVAKLLTPGKARVNHIPSTIEKTSMAANKNSFEKVSDGSQPISGSNFMTSAQVKNVANNSFEFSINSNLNKLPLPTRPTSEVSQFDRRREIKEKNEIKRSEPVQPQIKQILSSSTNLSSGSVTDLLLKDKQESSVKNSGLFSFSMPIPFAAPSDISKEANNSKSFKFTFRSPLKVKALSEPATPALSKYGFGDAFKIPSGAWECDTCLVQNKESSSCCIACSSPKPNNNFKISSTEVILPKITENNWGDAFLPPNGAWDCPICLLQNQDSAAICAACETIRPSSNDSSSKKKILGSPNVISNLLSCQSSEGMWECQICLVKNVDSVTTCIACKTSKSYVGKEVNNWGEKFKPSKDTWDCDICLLQNSAKATSCVACQASRPCKGGNNLTQTMTFATFSNIEKNSDGNGSEKATNNFKFGCGSSIPFCSTFGSDSGKLQEEWQCETCLVRNKLTANKCISCEAPKNKISSSTLVSEAMTGNFKFSAGSNVDNRSLVSTSSFPVGSALGANNSIGTVSFKASDGFKVNNTTSCETSNKQNLTPTFSFGLKNISEKVDNSNISAPSVSNSSSSGQSTSTVIKSTVKDLEVKSASENSFSFGNISSGKSSSSLFSFGASANTNNEKIAETPIAESANKRDTESNGKNKADKQVDIDKPFNSGIFEGKKTPYEFSHSPQSEAEPNKLVNTTFSFGEIPKSKCDSSQISKTSLPSEKLFTFGNTLKPDSGSSTTPLFSFGPTLSKDSKEAPSTGGTSTPLFSFGPTLPKDSKDAISTGGTCQSKEASTPVFSFGSTLPKDSKKANSTGGTCQSKEASTPAFSFGSTLPKDSKDATSTGVTFQPKDAGSNFTPAFSFGSTLSKDSNEATLTGGTSIPVFSFNVAVSKDSKETASTANMFQSPKFTFGQNVSNDKEKLLNPSSMFSFGESNPKPLNATFSFGNSPAVVSKEATKFSFGESGATSGLSFGAPAADDKPQSIPTFSFGGSQSSKQSFNFGGDSTTSFSFGKTSESSNNSPSSMFQFGNQNKLGDATKSMPEPSFGGLETNPFNVLSTPSVASSKRVIRKAVRRNK